MRQVCAAVSVTRRVAEPHAARDKLCERALDKAVAALEVDEQRVPERVAGELPCVADDDEAVAAAGDGDVEAARVAEDAPEGRIELRAFPGREGVLAVQV